MSECKISNFYHPGLSNWMTWNLEWSPETHSDSSSDESMEVDDEFRLPIGLIDTWAENNQYRRTLELMKIEDITADNWVEKIRSTLSNSFSAYSKNWRQPLNLEPEISSKLERNSSIVADFIWRKLPISTIWKTHNTSKRLVRRVFNKFSHNLIKIDKKLDRGPGRRQKVTPDKIAYIREFVDKRSRKFITLQQVCRAALFKYPEMKTLSKSTMSSIFKNELELSYKKATTKDTKTNNLQARRKLYTTSLLICKLINSNINIIYIDECTVSSRNLKPYNWAKKGEKAMIDKSLDNFKVSMIIAVSKVYIVGLQATTGTGNAKMFKEFLKSVIQRLKQSNDYDISNTLIVCDNAPIHRANIVRDYLESKKISMLTLALYSSWSNPAEFAIRCHKQKIRKIIFEDR